jgi:hypothetical protein
MELVRGKYCQDCVTDGVTHHEDRLKRPETVPVVIFQFWPWLRKGHDFGSAVGNHQDILLAMHWL